MSQALHEATNVSPNTGLSTGDHQYPPRSAQNQASQDGSNFADGSWHIFSMYLDRSKEEDEKMAESWQADANGILVFTGLFSATVASLISVSIQDIRPNLQDTSNFYLAHIFQAIADPNQSNISSSLHASPPPFSPPKYAVWVNSLWFLSLAISITCALLATLLQQWARRYLKVTQTHYSLHKRARIRTFFSEGVEKSLLPLVIEALPTLIHVSLFLFFAGLVVFLLNVNLTIYRFVLSWVSVCTALYGFITLIPIFRHDRPYYTPLTALVRYIIAVILFLSFVLYYGFGVLVFCFSCCHRPDRIFENYLTNWLEDVWDMTFLTPEEAALKSPSDIDTRALMWTLDRLDEDHNLENFFSGLPGFHGSKVLKDPLRSLNDQQRIRLLEAMVRLLDRTFSSDLLPDQVKRHRANICTNAIDLVDTSKAFPEILCRLVSEDGYGPVQSTEIVHFVRCWANRKGEYTTLVQATFSIVVARVRQHNDSWFTLASNELGVPENVQREHAAHGDNLSLAILVHITHQQFIHLLNPSWPSHTISDVLEAVSKFNTQDTSPELQHGFCALWNKIVLKAQNDDVPKIAYHILRRIRKVYITLHHDTDSSPTRFSASTFDWDVILRDPSSYPMCNVAGHIHDDSASATFARADPHDDTVLSPPSLASPPAPFHIDKSLTTLPPLDNSHTHQTIHSFHATVTSPDQATTSAIQDIVASDTTGPRPTPETSTSAPLSFTFPPASVSLRHDADLLTHSDSPNLPSSSSSNPVVDNLLPTESHRSIITTTALGASPGQSSAHDLSATVEDNGNTKIDLRNENDALELPSVDHAIDANTMVTLDLLRQSSSPPPVTGSDVANAGRTVLESNTEHTEDHPPDPSRYNYDIV